MDETGIMEGIAKLGKTIGSLLTHYSIHIQSEARTWVSICECINTDGRSLRPSVVFKGANLQVQWFGKSPLDWAYTSNSSAWFTSELYIK